MAEEEEDCIELAPVVPALAGDGEEVIDLVPVAERRKSPLDAPHREVRVQCAKCGKSSPFSVYDRIVVADWPGIKELVVTGDLFVHRCPHCGDEGRVPYPLTYIDDNASAYINECLSDSEAVASDDSKRCVDTDGWDEAWRHDGGHDVRQSVVGFHGLSEIILATDAHLDTCVMAKCKQYLRDQLGLHVSDGFYFDHVGENGSLHFCYKDSTDGRTKMVWVGRDAYDHFEAELKRRDYEPLRLLEYVDYRTVDELLKRSASETEPTQGFMALKEAVAEGGGDSWFELGVAYYNGDGVSKNLYKAFLCFRTGAEAGSVEAQNALATCYINGFGVTRSTFRAGVWWSAAAKQGSAEGMYGLGLLAQFGERTFVKYDEARDWYEKAAAGGYARANYNLGVLYEQGLGVDRDLYRARDFYREAMLKDVVAAARAYKRVDGELTRRERTSGQTVSGGVFANALADVLDDSRDPEPTVEESNDGSGAGSVRRMSSDSVGNEKWLCPECGEEMVADSSYATWCCEACGFQIDRSSFKIPLHRIRVRKIRDLLDSARVTDALELALATDDEIGLEDGALCFELGEGYESGRFGSVDMTASVAWYKRAAEKGYRPAHEVLRRLGVEAMPWRADENRGPVEVI